jgi:hypothetical protein
LPACSRGRRPSRSARRWPEGSGSKVKVHFTADEGVAWDDEVVVVKEDGRYVIDDVVLSGIGQFNPPGRLSTNLASRGE